MEGMEKYIGKTAWFMDGIRGAANGVVYGHDQEGRLRLRCEGGSVALVPLEEAYDTMEECLAADYSRFRKDVEEKKAGIRDMESLLRFLYGMGDSHEERTAARERARELAGVELDPERAAEESYIQECLDGLHDQMGTEIDVGRECYVDARARERCADAAEHEPWEISEEGQG